MMELICIRIDPGKAKSACIRLVRAFSPDLPMGEIRRRMEAGEPVVTVDLLGAASPEESEACGCALRAFFKQLEEAGARLTLYRDGQEISAAFLDNWLHTLCAVWRDTLRDVERELEESEV